jgi:hypothetical protein
MASVWEDTIMELAAPFHADTGLSKIVIINNEQHIVNARFSLMHFIHPRFRLRCDADKTLPGVHTAPAA